MKSFRRNIRKVFFSFGHKVRTPKAGTPVPPEFEEKEIAKLDGAFGAPQDVREVWSLEDDDTYVQARKKRGIPKIIIPAMVFILVIALLFWILPVMLPKIFKNSDIALFVSPEPVRIYGSDDRVVTEYVSSIMAEANVKSARISQVLFNEPVKLLSNTEENGYVKIRTVDGIEGYILAKDLSANMDSVEPDLHQQKLVVSDISKNVMSHASNGTLEIEVMMNTVLFSDQKRDGVYHVALPEGKDGWISSSGVIELGIFESVEKVSVRYFVSSVLSCVNMTQLDHGITKKGLSVEGLVYVSASVNGLSVPRRMEDQMTAGKAVELRYDEVTGELDIDSIMPGDIVFLRHAQEPDSRIPVEMGICTDTGMLLMISKSKTTLRLFSFSENEALHDRIISVRRIFE